MMIHLIVQSVVTFIHFQLEHDFMTISDWFFRNGMELLLTTKLISLAIFLKWLTIYYRIGQTHGSILFDQIRVDEHTDKKENASEKMGHKYRYLNSFIFITMASFLMVDVHWRTILDPFQNKKIYDLIYYLFCYFGLYAIEMLVVGSLLYTFPSTIKQRYVMVFVIPCLFLLFLQKSLLQMNGFGSFIFFHYSYLLLAIFLTKEILWKIFFIYFILVMMPSFIFVGQNFLSQDHSLIFAKDIGPDGIVSFIIWIVACLYLKLKMAS
jgi:hypothetical protein